jgi:CspA family cold shock protein
MVAMAGSGSTIGTVVRWDGDRAGAILEAPEVPGGCWADASVVEHSTVGAGELRAGQVVAFDWTDEPVGQWPFRAVRVVPREDLQATLGG